MQNLSSVAPSAAAPTSWEDVRSAYQAKIAAEQRFIQMCRATICGVHYYTPGELKSAAETSVEAHKAFHQIMAPYTSRSVAPSA